MPASNRSVCDVFDTSCFAHCYVTVGYWHRLDGVALFSSKWERFFLHANRVCCTSGSGELRLLARVLNCVGNCRPTRSQSTGSVSSISAAADRLYSSSHWRSCGRHACCCNLSVRVALNVQFTTNGMCAKNNTHLHVARTSNNIVSTTCDLCCCLLPQCEALHTCRSGFPIATVLAAWLHEVNQLLHCNRNGWLN